jgi:DNA-binding NarL/FixJ family response regulator
MTAGQLRVMVVDDHRVFAEALALAIDAAERMTCVAIASNADEAVRLAGETEPDVLVIGVPAVPPEGAGGIATARVLSTRHPGTRVLVLAAAGASASMVMAACEAGACALLSKATTLGVVCNAIPALSAECFTVDRATLRQLCDAAAPKVSGGQVEPGPLTRRERDILSLLGRGIDLQSSSAHLGITVNTARGYVKSLYRKLGVHNQLELLAVARDKGLLEFAD